MLWTLCWLDLLFKKSVNYKYFGEASDMKRLEKEFVNVAADMKEQ